MGIVRVALRAATAAGIGSRDALTFKPTSSSIIGAYRVEFRPPIFNFNVLSINVTELGETLLKDRKSFRICGLVGHPSYDWDRLGAAF
jgi:hypothetical protein